TQLFHLVDLVESFNTCLDCLVVCKSTTQPSVVDVVHSASFSFLLNCSLSLFLSSYEQDGLAGCSDVTYKLVSNFCLRFCLLKVNDVNVISFSVDVLLHLGVPSSGLVSEVNTCFQKALH